MTARRLAIRSASDPTFLAIESATAGKSFLLLFLEKEGLALLGAMPTASHPIANYALFAMISSATLRGTGS
jgi:hypothetical protein